MDQFTNILFCPLGDHDNAPAVRRVAALARDSDARLTLFGVTPEPSLLQRLLHRPEFFGELHKADRAAMEKRLRRWANMQDHMDIDIAIETGNEFLAVMDRVTTQGHDLVVVTSDEDQHDQATIKRLFRKCPCPVWVVRPSRARIQRVLAAINPEPDEIDLNREILQLASSMVARFGGELHLVHAWELYGEETMRSSAFIHTSAEEIAELLTAEEAHHAQALTEMLAAAALEDEPWHLHLDKGPAEEVVCGVIAKSRINLLVMGTIARTGLPGVIIGNTAEKVLDNVRCSVVAIKPPGFDSTSPHDG
ncbi:MAG: universal stress protein [Acidimicrobiales bacterium]